MSRNEGNITRLKALISIYDLSVTDIAQVAGVSRPLVSRILSEGLDGSRVWAELEKRLPELIMKRRKAFFDIDAVPVESVQDAVSKLKQVA